MLARVAADFYWMGRYVERVEQTARLLEYQLNRLVDRSVDELAVGWAAIYRALGQPPPGAVSGAEEAEAYVIPDAYTLAGNLVEEGAHPESILSCWRQARENGQRVRAQLPLAIWTRLNQGYLWMREVNFAREWEQAPARLALDIIDRMRLLAGVVHSTMPRDDAWRFLELGRFIERAQHQAALLEAWVEFTRAREGVAALSWADLLHVCRAYETYCRRHSMKIQRENVLGFLARDPELPRSLRFSVQRIEEALAGIDPLGARYPLGPPHRMALRLTAAIEMDAAGSAEVDPGAFCRAVGSDTRALHDLVMAAYVNRSLAEEVSA